MISTRTGTKLLFLERKRTNKKKNNKAEPSSVTVVPTGAPFPAVGDWFPGHGSCHGARTRMCSLRRGGDKLAPHP